jgi:hypothetical protein
MVLEGEIPTTPRRKAPPGIWILAFFNNVRRDHARNLYGQLVSNDNIIQREEISHENIASCPKS